MSKRPDAWDDDWVHFTAKSEQPPNRAPAPGPSRAQRRTEHAKANKELWEAAEKASQSFNFLDIKPDVPAKDEFKPQVTVLSRRPLPSNKAGAPVYGDDEDSEEERRRLASESLIERQKRAAIEREEKQRRYLEARERILGPASSDSMASSQPRANRHSSSGGARPTSSQGKLSNGETAHAKSPLGPSQDTGSPSPGRTGNPPSERPLRSPLGPDPSSRGNFSRRGRAR